MNNYEKKFKQFLTENKEPLSEEIKESEQIQEAEGDSPTEAVIEWINNNEEYYQKVRGEHVGELITNDMFEDGTADMFLNYTDEYTDAEKFMSDVDWPQVFREVNDD